MYPCTVSFMTRQQLHHVFHDSAEIAFSGHQNAQNEIQPWVSRLGKIAFSGLKNEKNLLKLREVPLNNGLHDSTKIAFSCPQNAENELTRKYVPLNRLFNDSVEVAFSGRQSAENELTRI